MVLPLGQLVRLSVLVYLVEAALGCYSSGMIAEWSPPDEFDRVEVLHLWSLITPMSGLTVALSLIRSLVFLHLELGSLLTSLRTSGVIGGGVMLIMFALRVKFSPVEGSDLSWASPVCSES